MDTWAEDMFFSLPVLMDVETVADVLRCSKKTVGRRISLGQLGSMKNGTRVVVPRACLIDFSLAAREAPLLARLSSLGG